ncbi:MAG: histone deacetylase family protein [Alphaproteobacteria bacterium]|nr:histone deacetylase family protein [Alphaproteobacteria bacterium]
MSPPGHPERGDRLVVLDELFAKPRFAHLTKKTAQPVELDVALAAHSEAILEAIRDKRPIEGIARIEADTFISAKSLEVVATGLGGALEALDMVMSGEVENGFCAIRPPGHHAERDWPMGFCLINTIAVTAQIARQKYGVERVAIVDFDVHHGNGTENIFRTDRDVFYGSTHQMPLYPGTGAASETGVGNIVNVPLAPHSDGEAMREAFVEGILPALNEFSPDLLLVSAGFDADFRDPMAHLNWTARDFSWVTGKLMDVAERQCNNRLVSMLEGGYDLNGLSAGVAAHLRMLMDGTSENE